MRLSGLASGMDTDSMVEQMMKVENMKVERVEGDKQILEWKKETLNELNKDFANFILDSKKDFGYNSTGNPGNLDWVRSATSSDESVGTAIAGKGSVEGKHEIIVESLVKGVSGASGKDVTEEYWSKIRKGEVEGKGGKLGTFNFDIISDNGAKKANIKVGENTSLKDIAKQINDSKIGINATYNETINRFFISTQDEGANSGIKFDAPDGTNKDGLDAFLNAINIKMTKISDDGNTVSEIMKSRTDYKGEDGKITYNGASGIKIDSNQKTINGINFDFKTTGKFDINVRTDTDAIVDKVKDFVDNYNKMVEKAGKLTTEKQNRDFRPLTDDERESLSDKEIEKWEEKAKSGLIRGDMDVERTLSSLRLSLYENLNTESDFKNITQIGITTQRYSSGSTGGLLEIDEDKLRKAIAKDADGVVDILFKNGDREATVPEGSTKKTTDMGFVNRIFEDLTAGMKNLIAKSGPGEDAALFRKVKSNIMADFVTKGGRYSGRGSISDIDNDALNFDKRIAELKERLAKKEEMYFAQFAAMEKGMQKANSQFDWLMQQMA